MNTKQKKTVYFVRHGQSVDNTSPVFQSINSPLSEKGRSQAKGIAERLSTVQFETLIASPAQRAKETTQYIAEATGKEVVFSDLFVSVLSRVNLTANRGRTLRHAKFGGHGKKLCILLV